MVFTVALSQPAVLVTTAGPASSPNVITAGRSALVDVWTCASSLPRRQLLLDRHLGDRIPWIGVETLFIALDVGTRQFVGGIRLVNRDLDLVTVERCSAVATLTVTIGAGLYRVDTIALRNGEVLSIGV